MLNILRNLPPYRHQTTQYMINNKIMVQWDQLSADRKKWDIIVNRFLHPITSKMLDKLHFLPGANILDVATGTGEPGLSIARTHADCFVVGVDVSPMMLQVANEKAFFQHITNYRVICRPANELPFPDNYFDGIICRNGVMFFQDMEESLREMRRVLKGGQQMVLSTWGLLDKNLWISIVLVAIEEELHRRPFNRYAPGMFYCMQPGFMTDWFQEAEMHDIHEEELTGIIEFDSVEQHWEYVTHVSSVVVEALSKLDPSRREKVRQRVNKQCRAHVVNDKLYFQWTSNISNARKPGILVPPSAM